MRIRLYTDGSSLGNPGMGGIGVVIKTDKQPDIEISDYYFFSTSNAMEATAIAVGLKKIREVYGINNDITIYSDSQYCVSGVNSNLMAWSKRLMLQVKNASIWTDVYKEVILQNSVKAKWVKGHNGHVENERCDKLATLASRAFRACCWDINKIKDLGIVWYKENDVNNLIRDYTVIRKKHKKKKHKKK